jgi:hypothetical protein
MEAQEVAWQSFVQAFQEIDLDFVVVPKVQPCFVPYKIQERLARECEACVISILQMCDHLLPEVARKPCEESVCGLFWSICVEKFSLHD